MLHLVGVRWLLPKGGELPRQPLAVLLGLGLKGLQQLLFIPGGEELQLDQQKVPLQGLDPLPQ